MNHHKASATADDDVRSLLTAAALVAGVPRATLILLSEATDQSLVRQLADMVASSGSPLIVADLGTDPRFQDHDRAGSRFYAGYPLRTPAGDIRGALTLTGDQPSSLGLTQHQVLMALADQAGADIEVRSRLRLLAPADGGPAPADGGPAPADGGPASADGGPASADSEPASGTSPTDEKTSLRVLVADDNEVNQIAVRGILTRLGYLVEVVSDGSEAIAAVATSHFDVILMDVHMPLVNGIEATRRIRSTLPADRWAPIIAMTASVSTQDREACDEAGMDGFLNLPMNPKHLASVLAGVTETLS